MITAQHQLLIDGLNTRDMWINPDLLIQAADEIDCGGDCFRNWDPHTNTTTCAKSDNGEYCPNDLAETLRSLARLSKRSAGGET